MQTLFIIFLVLFAAFVLLAVAQMAADAIDTKLKLGEPLTKLIKGTGYTLMSSFGVLMACVIYVNFVL